MATVIAFSIIGLVMLVLGVLTLREDAMRRAGR